MILIELQTTTLLHEGLLPEAIHHMKMWERAGVAILNEALTPQQIQALFQNVEKLSTNAGNNRTMLGQGKDALSAVNKAWEELKTKVQNSGPVKNVDAMYDQAAGKLKQATGGDGGVMQYVQKYRDFAKKHPVAQSFIYAAIIAAAGISGAGAGGAAALGLFKMVDKLLQGEKFSSAAYQGAKTGAMAYGASKIGDMMRGDNAHNAANAAASTGNVGEMRKAAINSVKEQIASGKVTDYDSLQRAVQQAVENSHTNTDKNALYRYIMTKLQGEAARQAGGEISGSGPEVAAKVIQSLGGTIDHDKVAAGVNVANSMRQAMNQSYIPSGNQLIEAEVATLFATVVALNEGMWDSIKQGASNMVNKVAQKAQTVGHNMTNRITADKLMAAWNKQGKEASVQTLQQFLISAGVDQKIVAQAISSAFPGAANQPRQRVPRPAQAAGANQEASQAQAPAQGQQPSTDLKSWQQQAQQLMQRGNLVATPALIQAVKQAWMHTGGTKVESKSIIAGVALTEAIRQQQQPAFMNRVRQHTMTVGQNTPRGTGMSGDTAASNALAQSLVAIMNSGNAQWTPQFRQFLKQMWATMGSTQKMESMQLLRKLI